MHLYAYLSRLFQLTEDSIKKKTKQIKNIRKRKRKESIELPRFLLMLMFM